MPRQQVIAWAPSRGLVADVRRLEVWRKALNAVLLIVPFTIVLCFVFFPKESWSKALFLALMEILLLLAGVGAAVSACRPGTTGHWKGTRIATGRVSRAGIAVVFLSFALAFAQTVCFPRWYNWFWFAALMGLLVFATGYALDARAHDLASRATQPSRPKRGFSDVGAEWGFAGLVFVVMLLGLWLAFFHGRQ